LTPPNLPNPAPDLRHERTIGVDLERFLPTVEIVLTDQHGSWPAPPSDDNAFVAALDLVNKLAELRLHLGERQRLQPAAPSEGFPIKSLGLPWSAAVKG